MTENMKMGDAASALSAVLRTWIHGTETSVGMLNDDAIVSFVELVERNRLDALMWEAVPEGAFRQTLASHLEKWRRSYEQSLIRNMQQQRLAVEICRNLEDAGIPCIGLRGPFAGDALYGDVAVRHFTDIDVLIPVEHRDQAWKILTGLGYRFNHPFLTRSACTRHHLEWPFRHADNGVSLDVHWAVDHPYKLYKIDYAETFRTSTICQYEGGAWRSPSRHHSLLLACLHAEKECRLLGQLPSVAQVEALGTEGRWRHWLDVAREIIAAGSDLDWDTVLAEANAWGVKAPVVAALITAATLFDCSMPSAVWQAAKGLHVSVAVDRKSIRNRSLSSRRHHALQRLGFRAECLPDAWRFLFPAKRYFADTTGHFRWAHRVIHTLRASCRLVGGALEWGWLKMRQITRHRFNRKHITPLIVIAAAMIGGRVAAHDFGDDVSDEPAGAEHLIVNGGAITRVIEIDTDEDWFTFEIRPFVDYVVTVTKGSLFDATLERWSADGEAKVAATNTLPAATSAVLEFSGEARLTRCYVRVTGMFEFTTGTYHISVSAQMVDTDKDGLPDAWEMLHFETLDWQAEDDPDKDGMNNEMEWLLGTDPCDPQSNFRITGIVSQDGNMLIDWQSSTGGCYIIQSNTNLLNASGWQPLGTNVNSETKIRQFLDTDASPDQKKFYRAIYHY